jgi:1,5-anhydro-D-fructose reductase (1,5-anhydro-D-mannitol-forming)
MRWGLIGTRGLAARACVPAFAQTPKAELVAVLSSDPDRARAFAAEHAIETATADLAQMLSAPGLEAVWITSPTFLHHRQAKAALEAGVHVLLEKPLAMTAREGWELVRIARRAGLVLATGYQARYVPAHEEMRRLVAEGAIGRVTVARAHYAMHRPAPPPEWRRRRESARWGALADIGTHHVDLLRMLVGEIDEAKGFSERQLGFETDDVDAAALRFRSGALGALTVTANVWRRQTRIEIIGTEGAVIADGVSVNDPGNPRLLQADAEPQEIACAEVDAWSRQLDVITRVAAGEDLPYATGEDGAHNLEILEQIAP